jgi:3-oxoacyl-[acyl-carrier-protein] synthase III
MRTVTVPFAVVSNCHRSIPSTAIVRFQDSLSLEFTKRRNGGHPPRIVTFTTKVSFGDGAGAAAVATKESPGMRAIGRSVCQSMPQESTTPTLTERLPSRT